jgi:hypothetical protein
MLPKKGSRRTQFQAVAYRWRESHGNQAYELRVELFESPGQLLFVKFPYRHLEPAWPNRVYRPIIVRKVLHRVIEFALANGWHPDGRGTFEIADASQAELMSIHYYRYSRDVAYSERRRRYV